MAAILTYVAVPDKAGILENVVLGFDSLSQYRSDIRILEVLSAVMATALVMQNLF